MRVHRVDGFSFGGINAAFGFFPKGVGVVPVAAAEGVKKAGDVLFRAISRGERVENRAQAHSEKWGGLKAALMAQKVQLHKQFIGQSPVERCDDMGEGLVKRPLAVCDGLTFAQRWIPE